LLLPLKPANPPPPLNPEKPPEVGVELLLLLLLLLNPPNGVGEPNPGLLFPIWISIELVLN
jgi:hypothetical protein